MRTTSIVLMATIVLLATPVRSFSKTQKQVDPWLVLDRITHKRNYRIETRDRRCVEGTITKIDTDRFTARVYPLSSTGIVQPSIVTFNRTDILRVSSGHAVYYNGRSSWLDVSLIRAEGRERLQIVTRIGKTLMVRPPYTVSDDGITSNRSSKRTNVQKGEIARIYEIAAKPLTANGEYFAQERGPMIIFDPQLYVYALHLEGYVPVLLYSADEPEDNSSAERLRRRTIERALLMHFPPPPLGGSKKEDHVLRDSIQFRTVASPDHRPALGSLNNETYL